MTMIPRKQKVVTKITLQERYLLLTELIKVVRSLKKEKRIFINQNSRERAACYAVIDQLPDMRDGAGALIGDIQDLLHHTSPIVTNDDLASLLLNAEAYAKNLQGIYKKVASEVAQWPPANRRALVHQRVQQTHSTIRLVNPGIRRHHYRTHHCR